MATCVPHTRATPRDFVTSTQLTMMMMMMGGVLCRFLVRLRRSHRRNAKSWYLY